MSDRSPARQHFETQLAALVEKFDRHRAHYMSVTYTEADVRAEFIDLLFDALGWDVHDHAGLGPREREVVREQGQTEGRPDYNFRVNGHTVFFVEAKAPHVALEQANVIMQAKQYAWHSPNVFVAAVTDFEEFATQLHAHDHHTV